MINKFQNKFSRYFKFLPTVVILTFLIISTNVNAAEVIEVPGSPEDLNIKIIQILTKVNPEGFVEDSKTEGFIYRYNNTFFSPYRHKIYIGRLSQRSVDSIVRVESSDKGQEKVWRRILEAELLKSPPEEDMKKLEEKSHFYSQTFNLIQPSFSVMYNSYDSPLLSTSDTFWASAFYWIADIILVGGAYAYAVNKTPNKTIWDNILNRPGPKPVMQGPDAGAVIGALAITRLYRIFGAVQDTRAHNNLVELEYSFRF